MFIHLTKVNCPQVILKISPERDGNTRNVCREAMNSSWLKGLVVICLGMKTNHEDTRSKLQLVTEAFLGLLFYILMSFVHPKFCWWHPSISEGH